MKVLSLFDGISCGMVALERAGIPVERYVAYEIEENAIRVAKHNYPMIEEKGDVFKAEYTEGEFDLLIGGSPCTYWSISKAGQGTRETTASGMGWDLFSQYVRALKEAKPKYFLYENNFSMSDEIRDCISKELGCEPLYIDSADFSAQHRQRYYWTNIPVAKWEKNPILFEDIMQKDVMHKTRDFSMWKDTVKISKDGLSVRYDTSGKGQYGQGNRARKPQQKWNTIPSAGSNTKCDIWADEFTAWHITSVEMERLQTLPDGYTSILNSDIKTMRCVGNGWTVDVIAHIFKGLLEERKSKQMEMELKMGEMQLPEKVSFNYEELKQELTEKVSMYETLVYTDDQIKQAKADKASLNKLKKSLNDERIKLEKEYMVPFNEFKAQVNEIIRIIDKPIAVIDKQVKEYEEVQKAAKKNEISEMFNFFDAPAELNFDLMFDPKWLNASTSIASIRSDMEFLIENFKANIQILSDLPEFAFEAKQTYISTLNLQNALNEAHRLSDMAKLKAKAAEEVKAIMEEPKIEEEQIPFADEEPEWKYYQIKLTPAQMIGMETYFDSKGIEFNRI